MKHRTNGRASKDTGLAYGADPSTADVEYSDDERRFLMAIDRFKREHHCVQPTWSDVLAIARSLGWRKVARKARK